MTRRWAAEELGKKAKIPITEFLSLRLTIQQAER
jgi:hypothetical protein